MDPGGSTYYPGLHGLGRSMNLKHQHGLRCWPRLEASAWPSVAKGTTDINTEPGCSRAIYPGMAPDITMDPGSSTGFPDWHRLPWGHTLQTQTGSQVAAQPPGVCRPLVATGAMDINTGHYGSIWATDLDMAPSSSPGLDITMAPVTGRHPCQWAPHGPQLLGSASFPST